MSTRQINSRGLNLIESFEELRQTGYLPTAADKPTAGWGHTGPDVVVGQTYSMAQCVSWLEQDLDWAEDVVSQHVTVPLTDNQFSALVSICYNIGSGNFDRSTLLKDLDSGDYTDADSQFLLWDKQRGTTLPGLERRRQAEKTLFETPDTEDS